jgi:ribosomal-protein-alanine N-acetyltransferase
LGSFPWPADLAVSTDRAQPYHGDGFVWGIYLDAIMIGTVGITKGELGYMSDPIHHRQGYGREAVRFAMDHAALPYVEAEVWHDNAASMGLLQSLGFCVLYPSLHMSKARGVMTDGFRLAWTAPSP